MSHSALSSPELPLPPARLWPAISEALRGVQHDFTRGSLGKGVLVLAVPMVFEMAGESLFAVFDILWVSRLGKEAVTVVGVTESLITPIYAVAIGLMMAVTATVARRIGEKDRVGAARAAVQAIMLGIVVSIVIAIPGTLFASDLLRLMNLGEETVILGSGYTSVMFATNVVILLIFLINAVFRGAGDPAIAMRSLLIANAINIVLDPCLIFGIGPFPELGLKGAAIATTCGRGIGVLYQLSMLARGTGRVRVTAHDFNADLSEVGRLIRLSAFGILQFLISTSSWIFLMRIVASFGDAASAGYTVAIRVLMFFLLPAWGLSNAAATMVGQNLGAGNPERAERAVYLTGLYTMVFLAMVTAAVELLPEQILGLLLEPEHGADVIPIGKAALQIIASGYVFYGWGMVMMQAFNGAGDTTTPTYMNAVCFWALSIPLAWCLADPVGLGPYGVFIAIVASESLFAVLAFVLFRRGRWKTRKV